MEEGEFWGVLGKNGAGKTSLMEVLIGFRWADTGEVQICGENIRSRNKDYLRNVSFLSHDVTIAGGQKISAFFKFHSFFYENYSKKIQNELLEFFEIDPSREVGTLSTGQQKKIQIIAALSSNTKLIVIDEITAVLDPETRSKLYVKLNEHAKELKKSIILATNLMEGLGEYADKILYLNASKATVHKPDNIKIVKGKS